MGDLKEVFKIKSSIRNYGIYVPDTTFSFGSIFDCYQLIILDDKVSLDVESHLIQRVYCDEKTKSWTNISTILDLFIKFQISPKSKVLVIGGGVIQDVVGFVCSIYSRGISYDLMPSTLLSMIDSCIGGKTSINYKSIKNKIGTFFPPEKIIIYTNFLSSLSGIQIASGLGEVFKYCILKNDICEFNNLNTHSLTNNPSQIVELLKFKAEIIERDEFDKNDRIQLNYGHTFGHALEITSDYEIPHGIAVTYGICIINRIACLLNFLNEEEVEKIEISAQRITKLFKVDESWFIFQKLENILIQDKKNKSPNNISFVVYCGNGIAKVVDTPIIVVEDSFNQIIQPLIRKLNASS